RRTSSGFALADRSLRESAGRPGRCRPCQPAGIARAREISECRGESDRSAWKLQPALPLSQHPQIHSADLRRLRSATHLLGHRQISRYGAEDCIKEMDEAGVNAAVLHPPGWDPNGVEVAVEAARRYSNRFAILGHFLLDRPENRSLIDIWNTRPGMLGLRYAF